jgi:quinol monooxygenase YgiN
MFHTTVFEELTAEAQELLIQTRTFRQVDLIDPLTLVVTMNWPDQATRDAFFANPAIIAHFEKVEKSNADKGITVVSQTAQEV